MLAGGDQVIHGALAAEARADAAADSDDEGAAAEFSPEARRKRARIGLGGAISGRIKPNSIMVTVAQRVVLGVWRDGFIHAGNLAYMAILALFPFFIIVGAILSAVGKGDERDASVNALSQGLPPVVARVLAPVAREVIAARHGWLLWVGCAVGLWTVSSLIETIRDILRRAYGTGAAQAWWHYRLRATGIIVVAVVLLLASLYLQVVISAVQELIHARFPNLSPELSALMVSLRISRLVPALVLFGAIYLLFLILTPSTYRRRGYPKWPGALLVALWWGVVSIVLPVLLRFVFRYNLTYGSLAGVMIALFFFWLVGLGLVTGAELNAALAITPEERDFIARRDKAGVGTPLDPQARTPNAGETDPCST